MKLSKFPLLSWREVWDGLFSEEIWKPGWGEEISVTPKLVILFSFTVNVLVSDYGTVYIITY